MNKVILIGRLTKDPEMKSTNNGIANVRFTIAVNRSFTNQNGEREADFISCIVWRKQAENVSKYCTKGMQVAVEGRLQTGSYDGPDGTKRYTTDVVCDNVTFLSAKGGSSNESGYVGNSNQIVDIPPMDDIDTPNSASIDEVPTTDLSEDPYKNFGEEVVLSDDDLPF